MEMPESEKKILEEVEYLQDKYFTFDEPVPFCGMFLYPVAVRNYNEFLSSSSCLTVNKNDEFAGIKCTHLEYLLKKMADNAGGSIWSFKFSHLIELVFHIKNGLKCNKCGRFVSYEEFISRINSIEGGVKTEEDKKKILSCGCDDCDGELKEVVRYYTDDTTKKHILSVDGHEIDDDDFAKFRKIVMYQNLPDFKDDSWVEKSLREDQALKNELKSKDSGSATLERKIACVCAKSNYKMSEISDMSMRKFILLLGVIQDAMEYEISRIGLMSGFSSLKEGKTLDHWIYKKDTGLYGEAVDADELAKKIQGG